MPRKIELVRQNPTQYHATLDAIEKAIDIAISNCAPYTVIKSLQKARHTHEIAGRL